MTGTEVRSTLAENIKALRSRRNWSQADLAEKSGLSVVYLSDIERGNKWPYLDTFVKIASAFKIDIYELLKPEDTQSLSTASYHLKYNDEIEAIFNKSLEIAKKHASHSLKTMQKQYKKK